MVAIGDRTVKVGNFPISIDFDTLANQTATHEVERQSWLFHEEYPNQKIILGLDRSDYTKGIPERIEAYYNALERYPDMREKVTFVQVMVPSRSDVPEYEKIKDEIDRLVSQTNSRFGVPGWVPIHYFYRSLSTLELLSYYRATDICVVSSLRDGMNLVCKEYCACNLEEQGILVLSEFAGAAAELQEGALLVNPYDTLGFADTFYRAFTLSLPERNARMVHLREMINNHNIYHWVEAFLNATRFHPHALPKAHAPEYVPPIDVEIA